MILDVHLPCVVLRVSCVENPSAFGHKPVVFISPPLSPADTTETSPRRQFDPVARPCLLRPCHRSGFWSLQALTAPVARAFIPLLALFGLFLASFLSNNSNYMLRRTCAWPILTEPLSQWPRGRPTGAGSSWLLCADGDNGLDGAEHARRPGHLRGAGAVCREADRCCAGGHWRRCRQAWYVFICQQQQALLLILSTGMLSSAATVEVVADALEAHKVSTVILDPVRLFTLLYMPF